jgi:hypothetical protein
VVAAHVAGCAACASEAVLEAALVDAARARASAMAASRHEAIWARLEAALPADARSRVRGNVAARGRHLAPRLRRRPPVSSLGWVPVVGLAAVPLALGLWLGGRWWSGRPEPKAGPARRLDLSLWEPEPLVENPMGPMTERLLILLEEKR